MKWIKNLGMFLLGIWLILAGLLPLLRITIPFSDTILALLAITAGVLILLRPVRPTNRLGKEIAPMATSIEVYWKNVLIKKFPSTFPFRREAFQRIVTDVLENGYTTAEAIAKHVGAGGSGLVDLARLFMEGMKGKLMTPGQSEEFAKGYSQLFFLLQLGFIAGAHGSAAAEEVLRQNPTPYDDFLRRNLKRAVSLLGQDLSGETFMVQMVQEEMRRTSSIHYIEGLKAARDTLLAYTDALENYLQGHVHL